MTHTNLQSLFVTDYRKLWVHKDNPNKEYLRENYEK